jgi:transcriptional regulator with XRE-family HTH domain
LEGLAYAARDIYYIGMTTADPFEGLGQALARLREWAGFATQTDAAERLGFDKGQLSRWESENPRPTLENLGRLLAAYGVGLADLVALLEEVRRPKRKTPDQLASEAKSAKLTELIRQMEERQAEAESRLKTLEAQLGKGTK